MISNLSRCQQQMILLTAFILILIATSSILWKLRSQQKAVTTFSKSTLQSFIVLNQIDETIHCIPQAQYINSPVCFSEGKWYAQRCIMARSSEEAVWKAAQEDFSGDLQFAATLLEAYLVEKDWLVKDSEVESIEALDRRCARLIGSSIFSKMIKLTNSDRDLMWVDEAAFHRNPQTWGSEWIEVATIVQDTTMSQQMKLDFVVL